MDAETALKKIERANEQHADDPESFDVDRPSYRRTFDEVQAIGTTEQLDALTDRVVQDITAANQRPQPEGVRRHAVDIFERHGVEIPDSSTLSPEDSAGTDAEIGGDPL
jgi:hypothetical protein